MTSVDRTDPADTVAGDCDTCGEDVYAPCPSSRRPCGHHCNHSWSHDSCCWCGQGADEDGNWPAQSDGSEVIIQKVDTAQSDGSSDDA